MPIKRYSKNEPLVFLWVMIPYVFFMNVLIFGKCILSPFHDLVKGFLSSTLYFFIIYAIFGTVAVFIKNRFPGDGDLFKRAGTMLPVFYLLNISAIYGVYFFYHSINWIDCVPLENMKWWTILYGCIMSTVITFINEGLSAWEKWKNSLSESEKLQNAYQRSKLLGLKGQINPHFLFNCFNTLSGLIEEDPEKAEQFLDEMTRVHRYLLRGDDEYLVPLADEMKFVSSYLYLTKARFGNAIHATISVPEKLLQKQIPPLTMQVLLENIIYTNALSKKDPLQLEISGEGHYLILKHSLHQKTIVQNLNIDEGLENLFNKYRLLNTEKISVTVEENQRRVKLPLFSMTVNA